MNIRLPSLQQRDCLAFTACGEVKSDDPVIVRYFKKQKREWHQFRLKSKGKTLFISVAIGQSEKGGLHCHVDFETPKFIRGKHATKGNSKSSSFFSLLRPLLGSEIHLAARCAFEVESNSLPPVIQSTRKMQGSSGGVQVKMIRGTLAVTGAPIERISWTILDEENAAIVLSAKLKSVVSDSYLAEAFESMCSGFAAFMRGGEDRGTPNAE